MPSHSGTEENNFTASQGLKKIIKKSMFERNFILFILTWFIYKKNNTKFQLTTVFIETGFPNR